MSFCSSQAGRLRYLTVLVFVCTALLAGVNLSRVSVTTEVGLAVSVAVLTEPLKQRFSSSHNSHCAGLESLDEKLEHTALSTVFSDDMVLQRGPFQRAQIFGIVGNGCMNDELTVHVSDDSDGSDSDKNYSVIATIDNTTRVWSAFLRPSAASGGGSFTINVEGMQGFRAKLKRVTFGDVYVLSGQSNMNLELSYTFDQSYMLNVLKSGKHDNRLRFLALGATSAPKSMVSHKSPVDILADRPWSGGWLSLSKIVELGLEDKFASTALAIGHRLSERLDAKSNNQNIPIGIVVSAFRGTHIESWLPRSAAQACPGHLGSKFHSASNVALGYGFNGMIYPLARMTSAGFVFYQGENNIYNPGFMHAKIENGKERMARIKFVDLARSNDHVKSDAQNHTGYPCLLLSLVDSWRGHFSLQSDTSPDAPFVFVSVSTKTSSKQHALPFKHGLMRLRGNQALAVRYRTNVEIVHTYDLGDPWPPKGKLCRKNKCCPSSTSNFTNFDELKFTPGKKCMSGLLDLCKDDPLDFLWCSTYSPIKQHSIHPRIKQRVGDRVAAVLASSYEFDSKGFEKHNDTRLGRQSPRQTTLGSPRAHSCVVEKSSQTNRAVIVSFDTTQGDGLTVHGERGGVAGLAFQVCSHSDELCSCPFWETDLLDEDPCTAMLRNPKQGKTTPKAFAACQAKREKKNLRKSVRLLQDYFKSPPTRRRDPVKSSNENSAGPLQVEEQDNLLVRWRCANRAFGPRAGPLKMLAPLETAGMIGNATKKNIWNQPNELIAKENPSEWLWKKIDQSQIKVQNEGASLRIEVPQDAFAIRYAWGLNPCCDEKTAAHKQGLTPCPPQNCMVRTTESGLVPDPFFFRVQPHTCFAPWFLQ